MIFPFGQVAKVRPGQINNPIPLPGPQLTEQREYCNLHNYRSTMLYSQLLTS